MKNLSRRTYAIAAIVLTAIIFVALNIAADATFTTERLDLTQTGAFTLAKGTKNIIAKIQDPITLKFFYSKKVAADYAQINAYAGRVHDLLEEYAARSHGKIIVEDVDAEPFTPAEDEAAADGLSGAPTESGDTVYFGLVGTNTIDGREIVPFFSAEREPYLEYDISSLIYRLSTPKKPILGIITSLPLDTGAGGMMAAMQGQAQPFMIYQQLNQTYTTKMLDLGFTSIPRDIDVLMIAHPGNLTPQQLYAIDQFVLGGGRALVFVDPMSELSGASQPPGGEPTGPASSDLPELFKAWGIAYNPAKVLADRLRAQAVQVPGEGGPTVVRYPIWLQLTSGDFDAKDQVTSSLQTLNLASVGALSQAKRATTIFTPLVSSSNEASLLDSMDVRMNPRPQDLMAQIEPTGERYTIAARVSGPVKTAFPKGVPGGKGPGLTMSRGPINVIVMADSDIFDDKFWVHVENVYGKKMAAPFADNAAFVLNAVENLMGSNDLISLRTRAANSRPFVVVQKMQAEAQAEFQQQADALKQQLTDTEARLHALEQGGSTNGQPTNNLSLTPDQQGEIERFKRQLVQTRTDLREVQHNLRGNIDLLGSILAFINIWLVPILVSLFAIAVAVLRRRRRARAVVA
jgi:ABC-type uncharacterized transport system involved in gliding motility auxiliary subunit